MNATDNHIQPQHNSQTRRERLVRCLTHLICLGIVFILPEILNSMGKPFRTVPELKLGVYAKGLVFIAVFYINYCFIIGRSFERKRFAWRLIGYNLIVIAAAFMLFSLISVWMQPYWDQAWRIRQAAKGITEVVMKPKPEHHEWLKTISFYARDFVMLVLTIGLSIALKLSDTWLRISRRTEQLEAARRQEELQSLKSQLNPHFLFNTLNSIYALIEVSPTQAQEAIHELSGMLRYVLYDNRKEVELSRELTFVENYVKLMSLRLPASTKVECELNPDSFGQSPIPPLLFIPLIENAFKHGNTGNTGNVIRVSIKVEKSAVICETLNNFRPIKQTKDKDDGGIGLQNLRRRLQLIYGNHASLTTEIDGSTFKATLFVPLIEDEEPLA